MPPTETRSFRFDSDLIGEVRLELAYRMGAGLGTLTITRA
jgi:hypothetical protein